MRISRVTTLGMVAALGLSGCAAMQEREWGRCGIGGGVIGGAAGALGGGLGVSKIGDGNEDGEIAAGAAGGALVGAALGAVAGHLLCDPKPLPPPPPPPVLATPPGRIIARLKGTNFDVDKSAIKPEGKKTLDDAIKVLKADPNVKVVIEGHTDSTGSHQHNVGLAERRAESVRQYLVAGGVASGRLSTMGYAETKPIASNSTLEGRAQNRRVDLVAK